MNQLSNEHVEALRAVGFKPHKYDSTMTLNGEGFSVNIGFMHIDGAHGLSIVYRSYGPDVSITVRVPDNTTPDALTDWYQGVMGLVKVASPVQRKAGKRKR